MLVKVEEKRLKLPFYPVKINPKVYRYLSFIRRDGKFLVCKNELKDTSLQAPPPHTTVKSLTVCEMLVVGLPSYLNNHQDDIV